MRRRLFHFLLLLLTAPAALAAELPLERIKLPPGFVIELVARVPNARAMALGDGNVLYVASMREGRIHALELDKDYRAGKLHVIAKGLSLPIGVAYRDGSLYVSAVNRILRYDAIGKNLASPPEPVVLRDNLPKERHHGGRFIGFGPDGWLYIAVGAPCNVCDADPDWYSTILRMQPDGSQLQTYARGIRNTVGFDWHPTTRELWFTENGRDLMGNDTPPDELNRAPRPGMHFGFPYCHGADIADPVFGDQRSCSEFTPPVQNLGPHVAALGMRFYTGSRFPAEYRNQIFIAEHGSWNRSRKIGYRITLVRLDGGKAVSYAPFATGWLQGERAWGRPVDVLNLPDGSMLVSDDHAGAIYRISYTSGKP